MFKGVNWLAVLVATVVLFAFGFLWFNVVFASLWRQLDPSSPTGGTPIDAKLVGGFITIGIIVTGLAWSFARMGVTSMADALKTAAVLVIAFDLTVYAGMYFFMGARGPLMAFYSASDLVSALLAAAVLTLMRKKAA